MRRPATYNNAAALLASAFVVAVVILLPGRCGRPVQAWTAATATPRFTGDRHGASNWWDSRRPRSSSSSSSTSTSSPLTRQLLPSARSSSSATAAATDSTSKERSLCLSSALFHGGPGQRRGRSGSARSATALRGGAVPAPTTMVAGKVWPALQRIASMFHPEALVRMIKGVHLHLEPQDWVFLAVLGFVGYFRFYERARRSSNNNSKAAETTDSSDIGSNDSEKSSVFASLLQRVAVLRAVQELAQVAFASYVVDILCLMLRLQHIHFPHLWDVPRVFAKTSFSLWALRQFLRQKRTFLQQRLGRGGTTSSAKIDLVDKAINVVSVGFMALLISDWVSVELGLAFKGAVTLGGVGTLAFTLASKDLASQLVSGMFLQAGNKMKSGEKVALGSSTGKVVKIGLTETVLRASDNTITSIPNAKVSQDKVINFSRVPVSQVAQKLRFHLEDVDELPNVLETIRNEIKKSCPKLILDGSRPFRVFFTDYAENSLEVMIDTHFAISPTSDEYWVNRQEVLMAIHRAVKSHRIQYAYSGPYRDAIRGGSSERAAGGPSTRPEGDDARHSEAWSNGGATLTNETSLPSS